jgi:hypothetical protein
MTAGKAARTEREAGQIRERGVTQRRVSGHPVQAAHLISGMKLTPEKAMGTPDLVALNLRNVSGEGNGDHRDAGFKKF